jgi:hypothetical protein
LSGPIFRKAFPASNVGPQAYEELPLFFARRDSETFKLVAEADVGVEPRRICVEVKEGARAAVEGPPLLLPQHRDIAQLHEERFEFVQIGVSGVAHSATELQGEA